MCIAIFLFAALGLSQALHCGTPETNSYKYRAFLIDRFSLDNISISARTRPGGYPPDAN